MSAEIARWTSPVVPALAVRLGEMAEFGNASIDVIAATPFQDPPDGVDRYGYGDGQYPCRDGNVLRAMIHRYRPRCIIESGSGHSIAGMSVLLQPVRPDLSGPRGDIAAFVANPGGAIWIEVRQ